MESLGFEFNKEEMQKMIKELDPKNSGEIDFQKLFTLIHQRMSTRDMIDQIQLAFDMMDEGGCGYISFSDLKDIAKKLDENISDQEIHEMINEADVDEDGKISFEEFVSLIRTATFS